MDLPIDRTQPARAADPLMRGTVSRGAALWFALIQIPLMFGVSVLLGANTEAHIWLLAATVCMAIYNMFGKRCPILPLIDGIQGLSWACMTVYGALTAGADITALTVTVAATGVVYTTLINGVHGGMRDLANDASTGARTTALCLGVRPGADGRIHVPPQASAYCWPLVTLLIALAALAFRVGASPTAWPGIVGVAVTGVACVLGMWRVLNPDLSGWNVIFRLHLVVLLRPMLFGALSRVPLGHASGIVGLFIIPMALIDLPRRMLTRLGSEVLRR